MSDWLSPPPAVEKPPHPALAMPKPKRFWTGYAAGVLIWTVVIQLFWFLVLAIRWIFFHPSAFFPRFLWAWEFAVVAFGVALGHALTLHILLLAQRMGSRTPPPPYEKT